jgi:tight adherence protein C
MPIVIFIVLAVAAFAAVELLTAPARERRRVLERAAGYGEPQAPQRRERPGARPTTRALPVAASALAGISLRINRRLSLDVARERLVAAGLARRLSPTGFLALKGLSAGGGALFGITCGAALGKPVAAFSLAFAGAAGGYLVPDRLLARYAASRREAIAAMLPDALDLLAVSVDAGLSFDLALARLTERLRGPLVDELGVALNEVRMGESRQQALRHLADRVGLSEIDTFVRAVNQSDQLGMSIGRILRVQASEARAHRQAAAEEWAMKTPVKMLFPTVIFFFPALFTVLLGPAIMNFGRML